MNFYLPYTRGYPGLASPLYAFSSEALPVYVGQQMDVYIEAGMTNSSVLPERNGGETRLALQGGL
ncbi:MAG: hypothetical protein ACREXR_12875 [Gammaproteobacteria bacterium]